jgi:N-methylhydantoinase A
VQHVAFFHVATPGENVRPASSAAVCAPRRRLTFFGKWRDVPVYSLESLTPGQSFEGILIIEAETTTIIVNEGDRMTVNPLGWLDIKLANNHDAGGVSNPQVP